MASSQSVSYKANPDKVWRTVVKTVQAAGYTVKDTNDQARRITYKASGGGWAWGQIVKVTVIETSEEEQAECVVTVSVQAEGQATLTEGAQQKKLIQFVLDELDKKYERSKSQNNVQQAPGTSGGFGVCLFLLTGVVGFWYTLWS